MKRSILFLLAILLASTQVRAQDEYYFGGRGRLNPAIPTPESFFGFQIGKSLVRYDKVVEYFRLLAEKSDRATLEVFGHSWEGREQVALIVTSPANLKNLENIRREHLKVTDPAVPSVDVGSQKVIVHLGYNVHGGEIAGTDASVVAAYYLAASEDPDIVRRLDEAVVFIEPSLNPDGRERAVTFLNGFHSLAPVADPADRVHSGGFVPHRGNHFWNDLNRDWLPLSQVESQNRVAYYHKWYPNVYLDFHEMGSASTYYFEPSPPPNWDPVVPQAVYEVLNNILAKHFSQALNSIGSLYYTKEDFTNYSPIYGSTYPDFQGGVGTTLEVGSTSGILIETDAGIRTFSRNVLDNFLVSIAALRAATEEKAVFLNHQKDFFKSALTQADKQAEKYVVFGSREDRSLNSIFLHLLLQHKIEVYELTAPFTQGNRKFEPGSAWVIPYRQAQHRVLHYIFEENTKFATSGFLDYSTWSIVHGYGIPFVKVKGVVKEGAKVAQTPEAKGAVEGRSDYAYAFEYFDYLAPKALYYLQDNGVKTRVAQKTFTAKTTSGEKRFAPGSIVIPVHYQSLSPDQLYRLLGEAAALAGITVSAVTDGLSVAGIDIGSNNIRALKKPVVAAVVSTGGYFGWTNTGELWQLLSNTLGIPLSKIDAQTFEQVDVSKYTTIVLGETPRFSPALLTRLTEWIERGGTLIAYGAAAKWAVEAKVATGFLPDTGNVRKEPNATATWRRGAGFGEPFTGAVFPAELNLEHTLAYGFASKDFYVLKTTTDGPPQPSNAKEVVLKTVSSEQVNGQVTAEVRPKIKDSVPVVVATSRGRGAVVLFGESPVFRSYWLAPGRILTNAVFFGVGVGGGRVY
ncbi:MAG: hypothetical protein LBS03_09120 [Bacteroidales bacterium]|jgi:hypothetical protein|nr:hypothetical protein [Bacteroidales bacterium]